VDVVDTSVTKAAKPTAKKPTKKRAKARAQVKANPVKTTTPKRRETLD
jgi:hypothetical protein